MGIRSWASGRRGREEVFGAGPYELRVQVLHAGTRSEGRVGRLYRDGVEVPGRTPGEVVDAGERRFTFLGDDRPHLWSSSGWAVEPPATAGEDDRA